MIKMVKKKILIEGEKVHDVGYRLFLMNCADDFRIENFDAKNIISDGKQCVRVLVESSEDNVNRFLAFVERKENRPENAEVDSIKPGDYDDYVKSMDSFRSGFMAYQQYKFVSVGSKMLNEMECVKTETQNLKIETENMHTDLIDRSDKLNNNITTRFDKLDKTITKEFNDLNCNITNSFGTLRGDYGVIYKTMVKMFEEMQKERKASDKRTEKLVKAIIQSSGSGR
ncbi:MAG: hypothetical protein MSIBF_04215 [Candidatus Altiarchaeales archaeon IMC4]|nr:MAG: hypothetical protein MSIBF_04215 [Candidatus Altiarchaeales archaeon IMC4]